MPTRRKPTTTYRSLFVDAARVAWERKPLWVFGLFAALLSTGGAYEMAATYTRRFSATGHAYGHILQGTFTGTHLFGEYVRDILQLEPARVTGALTMLILFGAFAIAASVVSQGALVAGTGASKPITDAQAADIGIWAFWDLLGLNFLHKAAHAILALVSVLPLLLAIARPDAATVFAAVLMTFVTFPLTIVVATLFMLASVHLVENGTHALEAVHGAVVLFRRQWLAALETGLASFAAILFGGIVFTAAVAIASIPFAVGISLAMLWGNASLFLTVNVIGVVLLLLLVLAFAGMVTTFQYAVWVRFYEYAAAKRGGANLSKIHQLWHGR